MVFSDTCSYSFLGGCNNVFIPRKLYFSFLNFNSHVFAGFLHCTLLLMSETFIKRKKMFNLGNNKKRATLSEFWVSGVPETLRGQSLGRRGEPGRGAAVA